MCPGRVRDVLLMMSLARTKYEDDIFDCWMDDSMIWATDCSSIFNRFLNIEFLRKYILYSVIYPTICPPRPALSV
jgi:hypothetical protein